MGKGGFRKIPDMYSPFFDSITDKKSREDWKRDISEHFSPVKNIFAGKDNWEAIVMQMPGTVAGMTEDAAAAAMKLGKTRLRIKGLTEYSHPEPCEFRIPGDEAQEATNIYGFMLGCHPEGLSRTTVEEGGTLPKGGDVVRCGMSEGPGFLGRIRGLVFDNDAIARSPNYEKQTCSARLTMNAEDANMSSVGGTGGTADGIGGGGVITTGATRKFAGDAYTPALAAPPYTPRSNKGAPYNPRGGAKSFTSDKRGPDFNGPDGNAVHPWQVVGACYPTHPNRTVITAKFAQQRDSGKHTGVDIGHGGDGPGEPMYAVLDGKVVVARNYSQSAGAFLMIRHEGTRKDGKKKTFCTQYMHCEAFYVKKGEMVKKGQHVADMGNTGNSYGTHLHFEVWWGAKSYDWDGRKKYRVNPTIILGLAYAYSSKAKKDVEGHGGEVLTIGKAVVEGGNTTVEVTATTAGKVKGTGTLGSSAPTTSGATSGNFTATASALLDSHKTRVSETEGEEFILDGIRYISVPTKDAANRSEALRNSAAKTGKEIVGKYDKSFETSPGGRQWVVSNIYEIGKPGRGASWGKYLGVAGSKGPPKIQGESHWSSWYHKVAYLNWWDEPGLNVGKHGEYYYDYPFDQGLRQRNVVRANPDAWIGKTCFISCRTSEAPLYVGDSVFNGRSGGPTKYSNPIKKGASHMRVIRKITKSGDGYKATVNGGNEGARVGEGTFKMNSQRVMEPGAKYGKRKYLGTYKHVKVLGKV